MLHCLYCIVQMFLNGPTLSSLSSSLLLHPSDDELEEDSDDEDDDEETTFDRLMARGSRRRRRNRRRSGLSRHHIPWPSIEPRGIFPRYVMNSVSTRSRYSALAEAF